MFWTRTLTGLAACILLSCAAQAAELKLFQDKGEGVAFQYPGDWRLQPKTKGSIATLFAPDGKASLILPENISVASQPMLPDMDLAAYTRLNENQLSGETGAELLESKPVDIGGIPGHSMVTTGSYNAREVKFLTAWTIRNGKAYVLSYGALKENYDKMADDAKKVLASLKFIDGKEKKSGN